jgi:biotin-dependent carboxylase-like uncharacterized protein
MIRVTRAGPLCTLQDDGRFGLLAAGISASGPMDRGSFALAGGLLERAGSTGIEFTAAGIGLAADVPVRVAWAGGSFRPAVNGAALDWPGTAQLVSGDRLEILPGPAGNYGYLRFDREIDVPQVLGSRSTNLTVQLGGLDGRALRVGDTLALGSLGQPQPEVQSATEEGPIRFVWGLHADLFASAVRAAFLEQPFQISPKLDRMGARLVDKAAVFSGLANLSLVSDPIVCGDIQILGDGTPIVLLRDHQPTGGYPRIGTVISTDLDRLVQLRPGSEVRFSSMTVARALGMMR